MQMQCLIHIRNISTLPHPSLSLTILKFKQYKLDMLRCA